MLGLYDSGLGGLTVLAALRAAGVDQDVVYFADQAHVPYGDRTDANLHALLAENFAYLKTHGVEAVVMACNTSCAVASKLGWPPTRFPVLDLIESAAQALAQLDFSRIAVVATAATVRSGAYAAAIRRHAAGTAVVEVAAPALVPIVERGQTGTPAALEAVRAACAQLPSGIEAVVYGCTHYPLLDREFAAVLGEPIVRIDPARAQAQQAVALVRARGLTSGRGTTHYITNGNLAAFEQNVRTWTGDRAGTFAFAGALAS